MSITNTEMWKSLFNFLSFSVTSDFKTSIWQAGRKCNLNHSWRFFTTPRSLRNRVQRQILGDGVTSPVPGHPPAQSQWVWGPAALWHFGAIGILVRTGAPCLRSPCSPPPWLCCQEIELDPHSSGAHRRLCLSLPYPLAFLVPGNPTHWGRIFLLSKSWPSSHLKKHSNFLRPLETSPEVYIHCALCLDRYFPEDSRERAGYLAELKQRTWENTIDQ